MKNSYILPLKDYPKPNPRIDGFRKLIEVKARTLDNIFVFSQKAFLEFEKKGKLSKEFEKELCRIGEEIIKNSKTKSAVIRRAFVVPGLTNPPGPRFLGLENSKAIIKATKELFSFAKEQGFHKQKNSQISGILYPFFDPPKLDKNNLEKALLPYGGYGIMVSKDEVEIYAVFGNNEGVQSLVADRYFVEKKEPNKYFITKKQMPQKDRMFCTTKDSESELLMVPSKKQFEQVLSDNEILEVARVLSELSEKYGPQRVEFSSDEQGIIFNEVADYWKEIAKEIVSSDVEGEVVCIDNILDLKKLIKIKKKDLISGEKIISLGKNIVAERAYDVLSELASWGHSLVVLYPGFVATQHAMRVLTDKGHRAFLVGTQKFKQGDRVKIRIVGRKVRITNLTRTEGWEINSLWDAFLFGTELCGGKAMRLSQLKVSGFQVPHGSVVTTKVFDEIVSLIGGKLPLSLNQFDKLAKKLSRQSPKVSKKIKDLLSDHIEPKRPYAVRSSATIEDTAKESMAGMFESVINVKGKDLIKAVVAVMRSTFSPQIVSYLKTKPELVSGLKMAVVVQELVEAKKAGVIFGAQVQTKNLDIIEIEAVKGLGESVVAGKAKEIERYQFSRGEKNIVRRTGPKILTPTEASALFLLSERLRSEFNDVPQDIEWAIDKQGQIWLLQSRDLII